MGLETLYWLWPKNISERTFGHKGTLCTHTVGIATRQ